MLTLPVRLLAVSKQQSLEKIRALYAKGQRAFGENYLQEALRKQGALQDLNIEWHFIGHIQSNKTRAIAEHFDWVQSVDRYAIAKRLNEQRPAHLTPLNICIQVNIDGEAQKSGIPPKATLAFATKLTTLSRLNLRGLMIYPKRGQITTFLHARHLYDALIAEGFCLDTLSMGTSEDYQEAIEARATMVRLGSRLFSQ